MLTADQLEARRLGIGGSDIAAILGEDRFRTPLDIWLAKVEGYQQPMNDDMLRGQFLEPGIADWYAAKMEAAVAEVGHRVHSERPLVMCTPDRIARSVDGTMRLVSIKAPRRGGDDWGETGGSRVPIGYTLQLQWEHAVLRSWPDPHPVIDEMHLVALVDGDLRVYRINADVELQGFMLDAAEKWWAKHVVGKVPPPLDAGAGAKQWLRRRFPKDTQPMRPATLQEEPLLLELKSRADAVSAAESAYEVQRRLVEESIGDAGGIEGVAGRVVYRANKNGIRSFKPQWRDQ